MQDKQTKPDPAEMTTRKAEEREKPKQILRLQRTMTTTTKRKAK
jgi:hypothetical protein